MFLALGIHCAVFCRQMPIPISAAILIPALHPLRQEIHEALAAIDGVHGDGKLPKLPICETCLDPSERRFGKYCVDHGLNKEQLPSMIRLCNSLCRRARIPRLTVVHEVGHFLAHMALGVPGRFLKDVSQASLPREIRHWLSAVHDTDTWDAHCEDLLEFEPVESDQDTIDAKEEEWSLDELWARAYSQFIAISSGGRLAQELNIVLANQPNRYWHGTDFDGVSAAIRGVLGAHKWI